MRVIAGEAKGRPLKVPKTGTVRPTTERVREALFSILEAMGIEWGRVLDLFAGSGALGIEALSRGGEWADFVEENRRCCATIQENLENTGLAKRAHVYNLKVRHAINLLSPAYDLVLLDPPFRFPHLSET